jgi:hypothetical protein
MTLRGRKHALIEFRLDVGYSSILTNIRLGMPSRGMGWGKKKTPLGRDGGCCAPCIGRLCRLEHLDVELPPAGGGDTSCYRLPVASAA